MSTLPGGEVTTYAKMGNCTATESPYILARCRVTHLLWTCCEVAMREYKISLLHCNSQAVRLPKPILILLCS